MDTKTKLDKIADRIEHIDRTLIRQESHLAEHMRRTELLEERMKPVETHVTAINTGLKIALILGGAIVGLAELVKLFFN